MLHSRSSPAEPIRRVIETLFLLVLLGGTMTAQIKLTAQDSLKEVRIFDHTSSDFAKAASSLGVDASLATLGAGASLVVAIRNDSGEDIDSMRILFAVEKSGVPVPQIILRGPLAAGQTTLTAPPELSGAVAALMHSGPGMIANRQARPLDLYQGATVIASIDSATLASGRFVGADTLNFFARVVEEQAARKSFFADLASQSKTLTDSRIEQALTSRRSAADAAKQKTTSPADLSLAAMTEFSLCRQALLRLKNSGLQNLSSWAEQENVKLSSQPTIHR